MEEENISKKIGSATKWSSITEVTAKLVSPITNMVLARLLTPDMFGVVSTVNIIISFTDIFTDAGFQKYLIQHDFKSNQDKNNSTSVAFWTNLFISLILWIIIIVYRDSLAVLVGNPDKGIVIAVACCVLPMTSFSSIQMALYKRSFDFKTLFYARIIGIFIPLIVTVPLAICLKNYWALIIGSIAKELANAIILTTRSTWKPSWYYRVSTLKEMFAFSMWTLFEQISIWLTSYVGTFIVGIYLTSYYTGLYKTSMTTVTQFTTLITAALMPVLFSTLSRCKNNPILFREYFLKFQKVMSIFILPMSVGIFLYRDFITSVLLGSQWKEASMFIGLWGLTSCLGILLNNFSSEAYRALGKPKISLLVQVIHLCFLIPILRWAAIQDFETLYWARSMIRFQMYITQIIALYIVVRISFMQILKNIYPALIASIFMGVFALYMKQISQSFIWSLISIFLCIIFYSIILLSFPQMRVLVFNFLKKILKRDSNTVIYKSESSYDM